MDGENLYQCKHLRAVGCLSAVGHEEGCCHRTGRDVQIIGHVIVEQAETFTLTIHRSDESTGIYPREFMGTGHEGISYGVLRAVKHFFRGDYIVPVIYYRKCKKLAFSAAVRLHCKRWISKWHHQRQDQYECNYSSYPLSFHVSILHQ